MGHRVQSCLDTAKVIVDRALTRFSLACFAGRSLATAEAGVGER